MNGKPTIFMYSIRWFDEYQGEHGEEVWSRGLIAAENIVKATEYLGDMYGPDFYDLHLNLASEFDYCIEKEEIEDAFKWMDAHEKAEEDAACDQPSNSNNEQESGDGRTVPEKWLPF